VDVLSPTAIALTSKTTGAADTINGTIDQTTTTGVSTFNVLDSIDGGAGLDTLNLNIVNGPGVAGTALTVLPAVTVANVETVNFRSAVAFTADVSGYTGLLNANVTQGIGAVALTAATTTAVAVSGATAGVTVDGGSTVNVNTAAAVTIGLTTGRGGSV